MKPEACATLRRQPRKGVDREHAKLKWLREAVEKGAYRPDPVAIAAALVRFERAT
jgi:anti-sigma28 factor (negative regulator of flagellin synthesis)